MSLVRSNAVVSTFRAGTPVLVGTRVAMGIPGPKDAGTEGGVVRYVVLFAPGSDVLARDEITILSWGQHTVRLGERLRVFAAPLAGGAGLEVIRATVGEWIGA